MRTAKVIGDLPEIPSKGRDRPAPWGVIHMSWTIPEKEKTLQIRNPPPSRCLKHNNKEH